VISKRVHRDQKTSSFDRLGRYVLEAKHEADAILWTRTAEYVVDLKSDSERDKVLYYRILNCESDVPAIAIAEVLATQAENTRTKIDKTYHCVISFPEGEHPTRVQLEDIEDQLCEALGFGEYQRISAVHQDTDNIHLHIAINKIHPKTFKAFEPYYDYSIRDKVCREMELRHSLLVDNGISKDVKQVSGEHVNPHTGHQTLLGWIEENIKKDLLLAAKQATSWQELHDVFSGYGLVIKPRGAGLTIRTQDGKEGTKASSVDNALSFKSLTDRLGVYQAYEIAKEKHDLPQVVYKKSFSKNNLLANALYDSYQFEKQAVKQEKAQLRARSIDEHAVFRDELRHWYALERTKIKQANLKPSERREASLTLRAFRQAALNDQKKTESFQQKTIATQYRTLIWEQFLRSKAENGDTNALSVLRQRKKTQERFKHELLTAEHLDLAKQVVYSHLKPVARKNGDLIYYVKDGGSVIDEKQFVCVTRQSVGASFLALSIASERFENQPLDVQGSDEFKKEVVHLAAQYNLKVIFKNPVLELDRVRLSENKNQRNASDSKLNHALQAFVTKRNLMRERMNNLKVHRVWTEHETGSFIYQGRRTLADDSQAVLLETPDAMVVKLVASESECQGLKVGQTVYLESLPWQQSFSQHPGQAQGWSH
jgi:hypothetical protein